MKRHKFLWNCGERESLVDVCLVVSLKTQGSLVIGKNSSLTLVGLKIVRWTSTKTTEKSKFRLKIWVFNSQSLSREESEHTHVGLATGDWDIILMKQQEGLYQAIIRPGKQSCSLFLTKFPLEGSLHRVRLRRSYIERSLLQRPCNWLGSC